MVVPKRTGYRTMVVEGSRFKWRFAGKLVVVPDGLSGRQVLEIDFGAYDTWLDMNDPASRPPWPAPVATPAFVAAAIAFALAHGWDTSVRGGRYRLKHTPETGFTSCTDRARGPA